jgi:hypothetical protein
MPAMIHTTKHEPIEELAGDGPDGTEPKPTLALIRDLLFSSKLTAAAKTAGRPVKIVRDVAKLDALDGHRLIVDLNADGHLAAAVAWKARTGGEVIGFIAHVAGDGIAEANRLGLTRILSNGGFAANVERLV